MGERVTGVPVAGLAEKNRISADDVLMLRREVFRDGVVTRGEAEALFALDASASKKCPEWPVFLVEAVADFIVHQEKPAGYISAQNAEWLVAMISRDGMVDSVTELELLVSVLEKAKSSPETLVAYALEQVRLAVVDGKGPLARGDSLEPGRVNKAEVDLVRRILYAFGGEGNIAISRSEAEVLFAINDASDEARNDPSWNELFVKAMATFVMRASGYEAPTREEALRHEAFLDKAEVGLGGFFTRMVSGGVRGILDAYRMPQDIDADWEARNRAQEALARKAEAVEAGEAQWLAAQIGRDGALRENEKALLAFIKQASPSIHPDLKPLGHKAA